MKVRAETFVSARVGLTISAADKVRDDCRHGRVEADHVHHAAVVRVGEGEAVGGHAYYDRLRVADEFAAILSQRLRRVDVARPRFAVRVAGLSILD